MKTHIYILLIFSLFGCNNVNKTNTFLRKIDLNKWNDVTVAFIKRNCSSSVYNNYKNEELIKKYLQKRKILISKLMENKFLLSDNTKNLVVSEDYFGINNIEVTYTSINDNMKRSVKISNKSSHIIRGNILEKKYDYDTIIKQKAKCINQIRHIVNSMRIETILNIDANDIVKYNIKGCYFSEVKID